MERPGATPPPSSRPPGPERSGPRREARDWTDETAERRWVGSAANGGRFPAGDGGEAPLSSVGAPPRPLDTQALLAGICPYLVSEDGAWRAARPMREHRCTAVRPPATLPLGKQRRLCLVEAHRACPAYEAAQERRAAELASAGISTRALAARQTRPLARTLPVALDKPTAIPAPTALVEAVRRLGRVRLAALILLAGIVVLLALVGRGAQDARPSPTPVTGVGATRAPSPTPTRTRATPAPATAPPTPARATPTPAPSPATYVVERGDTLVAIAARFNTTVELLRRLNNLEPGAVLTVGQVLRLPSPGTASPTPTPRTYVVQSGDTLSAIAQRFGTTVAVLMELNNISDRSLIRPGQVLRLP